MPPKFPGRKFRVKIIKDTPVRKLAKKVKKLEKQAALTRPEMNFDDAPYTAVLVTSAGSNFYQLTDINEGDGPNDRTGDQINISSVQLRLALECKSAVFGGLARVMLILHKGDASNAPAIADIFETYVANITAPTSLKKKNWRGTFRFLHDRVYRVNPNSQTGPVFINVYKKLRRPIQCTYDGSTGTQRLSNHIYMFITWDNTGAGNELEVNGYSRMSYTDV